MKKSEFKKLVRDSRAPGEKHGHALDRWAREFGYKDWNTMCAIYPWEAE